MSSIVNLGCGKPLLICSPSLHSKLSVNWSAENCYAFLFVVIAEGGFQVVLGFPVRVFLIFGIRFKLIHSL